MKTLPASKSCLTLALLAALCGTVILPARAQQGSLAIETALTPEQMKKADERFLLEAASGGQLIIMESKYALEQVKNPHLLSIARALIEDHEKNAAPLATAAARIGLEIPTGVSASDQAKLDAAMKVKTEEFGTTYLFDMAACHFHHILCFAHASTKSRNEAVKEYAARSLPALREHYTALKSMAQGEAGMTTDL